MWQVEGTTPLKEERSIRKSLSERFWAKVNRSSGCWVWTGAKNRTGYGIIGHGPTLRAHRVAYELTFGPIPQGMYVLHSCDNPSCVNPAHLFLGRQADNLQDMKRKGRSNRGERNPSAKLTSRLVSKIRQRYATGNISAAKLGSEFEVSDVQILRIVNGRCWKPWAFSLSFQKSKPQKR